jgi:AcrR family transcriptional regulator
MGLRQQHKQESRRLLEQTARELFETYGYDGTTIDMIVTEAQVSPRTFYRYFETKAGLVLEPVRRLVERVIDRLTPAITTLELLDLIVDELERDVSAGELEWALRLLRAHADLLDDAAAWRRHWSETLAQGIAEVEGHDAAALADRVTAATALHVAALASDEWILRQPNADYRELVNDIVVALRDNLDV